MKIQYLEIVTPDVDAVCDNLAKIHEVTFSDPVAALGNARTATLDCSSTGGGGGGPSRIGVRAPMREDEEPIVRPYVLVDDIEAAVKQAGEMEGVEIAIAPMEIPGQGKFAIYIQGGINFGLWQV